MSNRTFFNSMRARMTFAFVLLTTTLMLSVSGGLLFYLHYAAARTTRKSLDLAVERVRNELAESTTGSGFNDFLTENGDSLRMEGLALLLVDARGHILRKSQNDAPTWPHLPDDGWRIRTLPDGPRTVVIGSYWRRKEFELRRETGELAAMSSAWCWHRASEPGGWSVGPSRPYSLSPSRRVRRRRRTVCTCV